MLIALLNKMFMVSYILSCLLIIRHLYYFIQTAMISTIEEPKRYKLSKTALFFLGLSIAYVITSNIIGINIK